MRAQFYDIAYYVSVRSSFDSGNAGGPQCPGSVRIAGYVEAPNAVQKYRILLASPDRLVPSPMSLRLAKSLPVLIYGRPSPISNTQNFARRATPSEMRSQIYRVRSIISYSLVDPMHPGLVWASCGCFCATVVAMSEDVGASFISAGCAG